MNPGDWPATDSIPDAWYSAFEERFRGSREEVARRLSVYLPVLDKAGALDLSSPVLDLGCGRGEWLELLGQHGYAAKGVDLNGEFVLHARQQGMDVVHAEAVDYLSAQPEGSCAALTSFHLVEHLPVAQMVELLTQIHRVLCPGGILILETPNPENHMVGACTFHLDPTHVAPLPPALLQFLTEQAGFATTLVARVNADALGVPLEYVPGDAPNSLQINAAIHLLNRAHYIAPDYAVIAQKDGGLASIAGSPELDALCDLGPMDVTRFRRLEAEAKAREAEAKAREAEAKALEAETQALEAEAERAAMYASTSWRVTEPLRELKDTSLRVKSATRRCAEPPLRWLITHRRLRAAAEVYLPRFPALDRRVRTAIQRITGNAGGFPSDPRDIPMEAREVLRELYAARSRANALGEG